MGAAQLLSSRAIRGEFFHRYEERAAASWINLIASQFTTDVGIEEYAMLGDVPAMREWIGARRLKEPTAYKVPIRSEVFESTLTFSIDDIRRDKTSQVMARISDLSRVVALLPQKLVTAMLVQNTLLAYDKKPLFADRTADKVSRINNLVVSSGVTNVTKPTTAEMEAAILLGIQTLGAAMSDEGEPVNEFANVWTILVPTAYWAASIGALRNDFTAAGVSNTVQAAMAEGLQINRFSNPRLPSPTVDPSFYLFRTDVSTRAIIWQEEVTRFDEQAAGSAHEFFNRGHAYGVERVCGTGPGMPEFCAKVTLAT